MEIRLDTIYSPSEDVVSRDIEGELIIVPLAADIGDTEDALFTLNEVGRAIWERLDGTRTLRQIAAELAQEYDAPPARIEADVAGLTEELVKRKMVTEG